MFVVDAKMIKKMLDFLQAPAGETRRGTRGDDYGGDYEADHGVRHVFGL